MKRSVIIRCFVFVISIGFLRTFGQDPSQGELDSLEQLISGMDKNDTAKIIEIGEYIIEHSRSDIQKYYVLGIMTASYAVRNKKEKSIGYLFRARKIAEEIGDPMLQTKVYVTIASLYASLDLNEKARVYLEKASEQTEKLPEGYERYNLRALSFSEWGHFYDNNAQYEKANGSYRQALGEFSRIIASDSSIAKNYYYRSALYNVGNSYLNLGAIDSADKYLHTALLIADTTYPYLQYYIKTSLSQVYAARGAYRAGIDTLQSVLADPGFDIPELRSSIYLNLARSYKALNDHARYEEYNEKYLAITPDVKGEDAQAINTVFDAEQKGFLFSIAESRKNNQMLMAGILAVVALSAAIIVYIVRKRRKEKRAYEALILKQEARRTEKKTVMREDWTPQNTISPNVEEEILSRLRKFEDAKKFTNPKLSISNLAVQLNTNTTYLSEVINKHKGKNFNAYINELRVSYICDIISQNPEYLNYKISYLGEISGFNSHSSFTTVFKNTTGISPSVFIKKARKKQMG